MGRAGKIVALYVHVCISYCSSVHVYVRICQSYAYALFRPLSVCIIQFFCKNVRTLSCYWEYICTCRLMRRRIKVADQRIFLIYAAYIHICEEVVDEYHYEDTTQGITYTCSYM